MRNLNVFSLVSLDGYFTDANGDMSWAHRNDPEWNAFSEENAKDRGGLFLFGRKTFEMMAGYWPTAQAKQNSPVVAASMNETAKVVFSRTLQDASWNNSRIIKTDLVKEVRALKAGDGKDMTIMGSGSIVAQLAREGLIDAYQIAVTPLVLGKGRTLFEGLEQRLALKLTKTRPFANGNVVLYYQRAT